MKNLLLSILLFVSLFALAAFGQDATGRILGTVTDPTGAVVPGAKVTITNVDTGSNRETRSDRDGNYQVVDLPIGSYHVSAEATGFSKAVTADYKLQINQNLRIDLALKVGATTEVVRVEGEAAGVETVNATLGQSVTSRPLVNMPLNGRNVLDLALLQAGSYRNQPGFDSGWELQRGGRTHRFGDLPAGWRGQQPHPQQWRRVYAQSGHGC
jgi:hypothetical protein